MASNYEHLKRQLGSPEFDAFEFLQGVMQVMLDDGESAARDLVIRALDRRDRFLGLDEPLEALVRRVGLYPYLNGETLSFADAIAFESHRPIGVSDKVFHSEQASVYRDLLAGNNVILSAPTSFGKSLIIDSLILSGQYDNIVIIVPTIALIDEVRRRVSKHSSHKVISHTSQVLSERNVLVLTQERFLAMKTVPRVDLFMIDEFYKLNSDDPRAESLNAAAYRLFKTGAQFYLAGPNIQSVSSLLPDNFRAAFRATDFATVAIDVERVKAGNEADRRREVAKILGSTRESSIVYCQSPSRVDAVSRWVVEDVRRDDVAGMVETAVWLEANYHPDWFVARALRAGVGIHHGQLPRWLAQEIVRGFNDGRLHTLVCTTTLIEGVNTKAKNVLVLDKNIARSAYDYFTFANIRGRTGRMFHHFVGRAFLFHEPPVSQLPDVDIPVISQSEGTTAGVLLSVEPADLTVSSQERVASILEASPISRATLAGNMGIPVDQQIDLANHLKARGIGPNLRWSSAFPKYEQFSAAVELIWSHLAPASASSHGPRSAGQMAVFLNKIAISQGDIRVLIEDLIAYDKSPATPDDAVDRAVGFTRFWLEHNLPSRLRALSSIINDLVGREVSNYSAYAARVESQFMRTYLTTLEEFGIPTQIGRRLTAGVGHADSLDEMIAAISKRVKGSVLTSYERELVETALSTSS